MMSTQNQVAEHGVIHSSIALLQERFKQLQRVKEMREKKQLLTLFSHNYNLTPCTSPDSYPTATQNTTKDNHDHAADDDVVMVDDDDDDDLQIFLPPNYYYYTSRNTNNNPTTSCYSSSSTFSNQNNYKNDYHNNYNHNNEISLSLWPPTMSCSNKPTFTAAAAAAAAGGHLPQAPSLSTTLSNRPPSSCVDTAFIPEELSISDVDTTLHL